MTKKKPDAKHGRPPVPIEQNPQRFEIACIWAFLGFGLGPFDATRRALMVVRGGPITMSDIMGVLQLSQVSVPLPEAKDERNAAERRLFATAKRQRAEPWWTGGTSARLMFSEYVKYIFAKLRMGLNPANGSA